MVSDMDDMGHWVQLYVDGKTNGAATRRERLDCVPAGEGFSFGLGIGCSDGRYGYTGGLSATTRATHEILSRSGMEYVGYPTRSWSM